MLPAPFTISPLAPCSFQFFALCSFFAFPCSFFIFLCSLLLFNFSSCSMLLFQIFHCSMLLLTIFGAPCSKITLVCSLLLNLFYSLLLAPLCQIGLAPCSGITPNGDSLLPPASAVDPRGYRIRRVSDTLTAKLFNIRYLKFGVWMYLDNIADEFDDQGHSSKVKVAIWGTAGGM